MRLADLQKMTLCQILNSKVGGALGQHFVCRLCSVHVQSFYHMWVNSIMSNQCKVFFLKVGRHRIVKELTSSSIHPSIISPLLLTCFLFFCFYSDLFIYNCRIYSFHVDNKNKNNTFYF